MTARRWREFGRQDPLQPVLTRVREPVLTAILTRRSAVRLVSPAPSRREVTSLVAAAAAAPDHGQIRPWRLIAIEGDGRSRLGEALRAAAGSPEHGAREAGKPCRAPLLLSIVFCPDLAHPKVPEWEQLAATVGMVVTLLLLLHSRDWAAIWRTGPEIDASAVREHLALANEERLLGWLYVGTAPSGPPPAPRRPFNPEAKISWSRPPGN